VWRRGGCNGWPCFGPAGIGIDLLVIRDLFLIQFFGNLNSILDRTGIPTVAILLGVNIGFTSAGAGAKALWAGNPGPGLPWAGLPSLLPQALASSRPASFSSHRIAHKSIPSSLRALLYSYNSSKHCCQPAENSAK
jgi:hypothetical protein